MKQGKVYLVGAGPGDPGLITMKGLDCLKQSDVVLYDRLLDESLLDEASPEAEKIYVGKSAQRHLMEQKEINRLLIEKARRGKTVVRLKGGDPFVLGRGGEEAEDLAANHITFEIVPGVSSAVAVPAYAGIPVTHRRVAASFVVVTGHEAAGRDKSAIAWDKLSTGADTLVFLMGVANLEYIVERLVENGRSPSTPVAVIVNGTSNRQQTVVGTLGDIAARAGKKGIQTPAVIVVGEVVRLRERLRWFDNSPLFGKRILVTRPKHQARELVQLLLRRGAMPVEMPAIEIQSIPDTAGIDRAILNIKDYDWIVFTSVNGVEIFFRRMYDLELDARWLAGVSIGVIGPATAGALAQWGILADCLPEKYTSRGLLAELGQKEMAGKRFLLPRADIAGKTLSLGLARLGANVHDVTTYRTVPGSKGVSPGKRMLLDKEIDVITFTSASAVANMTAMLGKDRPVMNDAIIACIGPETAARAAQAEIRVDIMAANHTIPGLVEAMEQYFQEREK